MHVSSLARTETLDNACQYGCVVTDASPAHCVSSPHAIFVYAITLSLLACNSLSSPVLTLSTYHKHMQGVHDANGVYPPTTVVQDM